MIVPMKKVSLVVLDSEREGALKKLRRLGLVHLETVKGEGRCLEALTEDAKKLESAIFTLSERAKKNKLHKDISLDEALKLADRISELGEEKKACLADISNLSSELLRIKAWGETDPDEIAALSEKGVGITLYEMPVSEYAKLPEDILTVLLKRTKQTVLFITVGSYDLDAALDVWEIKPSGESAFEIKEKIESRRARIDGIDAEISESVCYCSSMKKALEELGKDIEFETLASGMSKETLSESSLAVAYLRGYIPAEDLEKLKRTASENAWALMAEDPGEEDDVPTKLKNNKLVSLIYPLTDFLGTVPGYFEYDISAWFLGFILIFFGIIFGDGGYGLLICTAAAAMIIKAIASKKPIPPTFLLVGLLGLATVLWGALTCTWFGLPPESLPQWLKNISLPVISNVNADRIWYPFWTNGEAGLTTAQNTQILCFSLALVQLVAAHIKSAIRNKGSLKILGDIGSAIQLIGIFYVVLALVVNGEVFSLGLVISGIPIGTVAIAMVGVGFVMSFVFANYEGSIGKSILDSLKNIVSVLLGVVNLFSDIVSYIRLWAVGLAGAAISATVNELAGPLFGNMVMVGVGVMLLVFGHGLNMILNVLSVIVHGVRLNTLEFSSHLDMSWSGHKYEPFEE